MCRKTEVRQQSHSFDLNMLKTWSERTLVICNTDIASKQSQGLQEMQGAYSGARQPPGVAQPWPPSCVQQKGGGGGSGGWQGRCPRGLAPREWARADLLTAATNQSNCSRCRAVSEVVQAARCAQRMLRMPVTRCRCCVLCVRFGVVF